MCELAIQYKNMSLAFDRKRKELEERYSLNLDLSLKVIAHYGPMAEYTIGRFRKLYGKVVVEAHRLLKNSIQEHSYLLLTDALQEQTESIDEDELLQYGVRSHKLCEVDESSKTICYTYLEFSEANILEQVA